ncbi:DgyrCDS1455 [Dimorphilus gyrociliatus]|uniref:DgyrCDS1455 n=1 Tax=Dimorphilus gyrociliatus TaxID=2664684 RepID=A0A7I8VA95_9ANNE|nr:DgyrCDS1455 [Dimorphilus gyrociliatus]
MYRQNIRVYPEAVDDPNTPQCPHGPCLLLSRQTEGKNKDRKFFACSACRNRKDCNFFRWLDQQGGQNKKIDADARIKLNEKGARESVRRFNRFKELKETNSPSINFCETCEILLKKDEEKTHLGHLQKIICSNDIKPSSLLRPLQRDSKNAQYHFSEDSEKFLTKTILDSKFERVVCIGTPRLYESLVRQMDNSQVVLMDIDSRYVTYENHKKLKRSSNGAKGSPVRIFTNISPAKIRLPCQDYRFCRQCERYVKKNNVHCPKCNSCTGKDGGRYVHCGACEKCVKESRKHCSQCGFCHLPDDHRRLTEVDEDSESSEKTLKKEKITKTIDNGLSSLNAKCVISTEQNKRMKEDMKEKKTDCTDYSLSQFDRTIENGKRKLKEKPDKKECLKASKRKKKHCLDYELSHFDGEHVKSIEKRKRKLKEKKQPATKRLKRKLL